MNYREAFDRLQHVERHLALAEKGLGEAHERVGDPLRDGIRMAQLDAQHLLRRVGNLRQHARPHLRPEPAA